MPLTHFQQNKCIKIIEKLMKWSICTPFLEDIDPERDGAPDYLQIIKNPISLKKILENVKNNQYDTIKDLENDVKLVWENAKLYNGKDSLITYMASEADLWFSNKMKSFSSTAEEEWTRKIQKAAKLLLNVISHPPPELDPNGKLSLEAEQEKSEKMTK